MMANPTRSDSYPTTSTFEQLATEEQLKQVRPTADDPPPRLQRNAHLNFLVRNLMQGFPARFVSLDASQPWLSYWSLQSCYTLGASLDPNNKQRYIVI